MNYRRPAGEHPDSPPLISTDRSERQLIEKLRTRLFGLRLMVIMLALSSIVQGYVGYRAMHSADRAYRMADETARQSIEVLEDAKTVGTQRDEAIALAQQCLEATKR